MSCFIVPLFDFFPACLYTECTHNPFDCIGIYYFERNGKKGYSRVLNFVCFYPKTRRWGYYYPGEGVKRVGELVKYGPIKKT